MSKKRKGRCVFCGAHGQLTDEDPLPKWVAEEFRRLYPAMHSVWSTQLETEGDQVIYSHGKKVGSAAAIKLPVVCAACNGGWMGLIEKTTKRFLVPTISGGAITLTPEHQMELGKWGTLKALTYALVKPNDTQVVFAPDLHAFFAARKPPPGFQMWLARYAGHPSHLAFHVRGTAYTSGPYEDIPDGTPHAQLLTFVYGELVVQSVYVGLRTRRLPGGYRRSDDDPYSICVWPPSGDDIRWPPPGQVTEDSFRRFADTPIHPIPVVGQKLPPVPGKPTGAP